MTTKDDDEQRQEGDATSTDEPRSSKKVGTLLGLGEDAVKASSVIAGIESMASAESADPDDEEEETKIREAPVESGEAMKFKGTVLGLGEEPKKAAAEAPPKPVSNAPPAAESGDAKKFKGTMLGLGEEPKKAAAEAPRAPVPSAPPPAEPRKFKGTMTGLGDGGKPEKPTPAPPAKAEASSPPAEAGGKKFGGTMVGLGESGKKDVARPEVKAAASSEGALGSKTLPLETSQPATEKRAPKKAPAAPADFKGKTLPLSVDAPKAPVARSAARPAKDPAEATPPAADKASGSTALWIGLAALVGVAVIWVASRASEEETPPAAEATATPGVEPAPAAAAATVAEPAAAEPVVRPVDPEPAAPSSAEPPAPEPAEPKAEKQAKAAPEPAPAPAKPAPKPVREPPRPAPVKVESPASEGTASLSPAMAARIAVGKNSYPAARCRQKSEPAGTVETLVTFAPSGQVTAVRVVDQYAGTNTATCMEGHLKQVTMDPFSGNSVTVRVPIQLR